VGVIALTNSGAAAGVDTLRAAGIVEHFDRVLGVDAVKTFKPHPRVYEYALRELNADVSRTALVATHPWDLAGAARAGITTAWVTHGGRIWPAVFPPPDARGDSLLAVVEALLHWPAAATESEVSPVSQG
jgi:2-haloacid dehalogenase